jgi:FKBP-type peptidyl-prolyl cis-trans isomerase FkpA
MRLHTTGAALFLVGFLALGSLACGGDSGGGSPTDPSQNLSVPFSSTDLVVGTGRQATNGNRLTVNYTLWLFDPSRPDNKGRQLQTGPFQFTLGAGGVITGWNQGLPGMAVGGKRRLVLPPGLAYGGAGSPPDIPSNATIIFEIDLLNVE